MSAGRPVDGVPTKQVQKAVRASDLHKDARLIMFVLVFIADHQTSELPPQFTPSTSQLARETGLSKSTVIRRRAELEAAGWIIVKRPTPEESVRHVRIKYRLAIPATGPHRAHAEAAARLVQGLTDGDDARPAADAEPPQGFTVHAPEGSLWTPAGIPQTPAGVSHSYPIQSEGVSDSHPRGVSQLPDGVSEGYPMGWLGDTSKNYYQEHYQQPEKPPAPAGADDREQRFKIAEELTEAFWSRHGSGSAQRRPAVRQVIITAVADNRVPRNVVAHALETLALAGQQITPDSLTKALARMRGADARDEPSGTPPPPRPPRRFCSMRDHAHVELTDSGLCSACAADARVREPDEPPAPPPGRVPPPRHAMSPDDTHTIPRTTA